MFIDGIGISNYRSFGSEHQYIGPFSKINLIIGQNNSGKSNVLLFLSKHYNKLLGSATNPRLDFGFEDIDKPVVNPLANLEISFGLIINGEKHLKLAEKNKDKMNKYLRTNIEKILRSKTLSREGDVAWFRYEINNNQ
jgi:AAA15 family ATPase/GTPase